jgi:hypothetical protein
MSFSLIRAARVNGCGLLSLVLATVCPIAQALPGPEQLPAPASFRDPQGSEPQQVAAGQAADGRAVVAFISGDRLYVQRLTAAGALDGATTQVLQVNGESLSSLALSVGSAGHYAVGVQIGIARVFVRRFNPDGSPLLSQNEPADGLLLVAFEGPSACENSRVRGSNRPAVAVDGAGNLAYSFSVSTYCPTGSQGALQPDQTALYYRYAPVGGTVSDPIRVFEQSPVTSAGFRVIDEVPSQVALQDNGDVLIAWNGHEQSNQSPRTFVRTASGPQLTGSAALIEAENSFDRSAPQLGIKNDGYVLSWRGDFNDPQTGNQRTRCYAQARARDGSPQFEVITLASCTLHRSLIVQAGGAFDVVTVPQVGQNQAWSGRRYDANGVERGFYSNGTPPNRFLDLGPRTWAPTLAGGRYLAIYNVTQGDGDEAVLEPVRYGGPNVPPSLQLSVSPVAIGIGDQAVFTWSSSGASSCTIAGQGEFVFNQTAPTSGSYSRTYLQPGTQNLTLTCTNATGATASDSRILTIGAPTVTVQASWSPATIRIGESSTLSYTSQNAQTCQATLSGEFATGAAVQFSGSLQYTYTQPGESLFTLTCTGPGGSATTTARLTVVADAPTVSASWSPATIRVGESTTLSYTSQNAQNCQVTLTGEFATGGAVQPSGSLQYTFALPGESLFTLTCSGPGGSATTTARLTVAAEVPTVSASWLPSTIRIGESSTLSYTSQNAQNCQATLTGEFATGAAVQPSGTLQYMFALPGESLFTLTCSGPGGSATTTARLTIVADAPTVSASWSPATIRAGESSTLTYTSQNAQDCQATLAGEFATGASVQPSGSLQYMFTLPGESLFTLTCSGPGGSATTTARLTIVADAPTVSASWSPATIRVGESSTLSYTSQNAQTCQASLTGEFATGAAVQTSGSLQYMFTQRGESLFTLTCTGPGGSATTTASLNVTEPDAPPPSAPVSIQLGDGRMVQLVSDRGSLINPRTVPTPANLPNGLTPITDFLGFDIAGIDNGASVEVTLTLPADLTPTAFIKCTAICVRYLGVIIEGNQLRITLTDGGVGDADGVANGIIQDPGAPAVENVAAPVLPTPPTSGGGAVNWLMLLMLLAAAVTRLRSSRLP